MSSIPIRLIASEKARCEYAVRTGRMLPRTHEYRLELDALSSDQRAAVLAVITNHSGEMWEPSITYEASMVPEAAEDWLAIAAELAALVGKAAAAREAAATRARTEALAALAASTTWISALEALDDESLFARYERRYNQFSDMPAIRVLSTEQLEVMERRITALRLRIQPIVDRLAAEHAAGVERANTEAAAAKAAAAAERLAWIERNGSDHLRQATAAGYNCARRYAIERCAIEHPGAVLDYELTADWSDRACPSERGLALAQRVGGTVVWLTSEPHDRKVVEEEYEEEYEEQEAVIVKKYLEQYTVVYSSY